MHELYASSRRYVRQTGRSPLLAVRREVLPRNGDLQQPGHELCVLDTLSLIEHCDMHTQRGIEGYTITSRPKTCNTNVMELVYRRID